MPHPPSAMGVAVSGGGDSIALLHLLKDFSDVHNLKLSAVTLDHGLRPEAAAEAARVAEHCAHMGIDHDTLVWEGWHGHGNLQQAAREARYNQISDWAKKKNIQTVAMGHTADDQAETVLMRLARRSGVDGLSGMQDRMYRNGVTWVRPLLRTRRVDLRKYLLQERIDWHEDPSNENERFQRVKIRKALALLAPLGIDAEELTGVAEQMAQARKALEWHSFIAAKEMTDVRGASVVFDEQLFRVLPEEIQRRLLTKAISWVSGSVHGPRREALAHILAGLRQGLAGTADGCHVRRIAGEIWAFREYNAVREMRCTLAEKWDKRWTITPPLRSLVEGEIHVRALGSDGLAQCPDWRASNMPRVVLMSTPSVWCGDTLVSAPLAGYGQAWRAEVCGNGESFFAALLTH